MDTTPPPVAPRLRFLHNQYNKSEMKLNLIKRVTDLPLNPTQSHPSSSNTRKNSMEVEVKLCLLTAAAHLRLTTVLTPDTLAER